MSIINKDIVASYFKETKERSISGRWIAFNDIEHLFINNAIITSKRIGYSEEQRPIFCMEIGTGEKKILLWTQMHGNESTGTKAVFDLINFLQTDNSIAIQLLTACTIQIIPMLNPDGAQLYTRENARNIDLNRDATVRTAAESTVLRTQLDSFQPDFCFNLHDQRTIFGVAGTRNPAALSFLAPSEDAARTVTKGRKKTMNVIVAMNRLLQSIIPDHIGRYTDEYYPTATGDTFQKLGYSTILVESGHYYHDYTREKSRELTFYALLQGLYHISTTEDFSEYAAYFDIPNNTESFLDIIHRNDDKEDVAFQYEEKIVDNQFTLLPKKVKNVDLKTKFFHNENDFVNKFH